MNDFETGVCVGYLLHKGDGSSIILDTFTTAQNGHWTAQSGHAWNDITVNVPSITTQSLSVNSNGTYTAPANTAYTPVVVNVPQTTLTALNALTNTTYTAPTGTAYNVVNVNVPTYQQEYEEMVLCANQVIAKLQEYDPSFDPQTCTDIPPEIDNVVEQESGYTFPQGTEYDPTILDAVGTDPITDINTGQTLYCEYRTAAESIQHENGVEAWYTDSNGDVYQITGDYDNDPDVYYSDCSIKMHDTTTGTVNIKYTKRSHTYPDYHYDVDTYQTVSDLIGYAATGHTYKVHNN